VSKSESLALVKQNRFWQKWLIWYIV